ncbi:nucleoside deaminase [Bordetella petrii]|uniref:nucleoside deaminase n=1 Tax=Bordetella petrii TaxID=94624 RepID=UPI001E45A16B|nr:nucleoside deaminase [Bordetella petrii]MCD0505294.1 nucleoside deaminase [Bordetella petrii]
MTADSAAVLAGRMQEAVDFSLEHVRGGGIPFTALVLDAQGGILARGVNCVRRHHDPTAHAEVEAIRAACRAAGTPQLHGLTLLASGEPCAMCYLCARLAGIARVLYAADRDEAAAHGFDYRVGYRLLQGDPRNWRQPAAGKLCVPRRLLPFQAYRAGPAS